MLRFVAAARCLVPYVQVVRVRSLQVAPIPIHLPSVLAQAPLYCKDLRRHYSSSEPTPYRSPSVIRPQSALVWQKTVNPALRTFLKLNHHLIIPVSFTVPKNDGNWPEETRGYPLGKHAERLRLWWRKGIQLPVFAVQDLLEMDFAFDPMQYKWDHLILPALCRYYELNGHSDVPDKFRVKYGDTEWPEKLWGLNLGCRVDAIRFQGAYEVQIDKDREELTRINFCFNLTDRKWDTRVLPSLVVYQQEFDNCTVPRRFVVPDCPPWPKAAAGLRLGFVVNNMRQKKYYAEHSARDANVLEKLGFVWEYYCAKWNDRVFPALETFKMVKGHNKIPSRFVVPCTTPWPEKSHGLCIGRIIYNIHSYSIFFDEIARGVDRLASLGFEFPVAQKRWDQRVEPMLATFEELHGHRDVPIDFVVPSKAPWKEKDWGIQLGKLKRKEK